MDILVDWKTVNGKSDPLWQVRRGLYSYLHPKTFEILYVGKVDGTSVRGRWLRPAKSDFWEDLERERNIKTHMIIVGLLTLERTRRFSSELLADVESLLIARVLPWGNIQSRAKRISRKSMIVTCAGKWPISYGSSYRDGI
jgi:hypothetical protein